MACRIKRKRKGNKDVPVITYKGHLIMPDAVMNHIDYIGMSSPAKALLLEIAFQFNGRNNGDLQCSRTVMASRGWSSNDVRERALKDLEGGGLIVKTRQGGRGIGPSLYAITWQPIHECGGKHDLQPTTTAYRLFREGS